MKRSKLNNVLSGLLLLFALNACAKSPTIHTSVNTYNFIDHVIISAWADGEWVGGSRPEEGGGSFCCVSLPRVYNPIPYNYCQLGTL